MPAVELNSLPDGADYDLNKQQALFKLWLLLTTNEYTVDQYTRIFNTTAEAQPFVQAHAATTSPVYYVDLEKLTPYLAPLQQADVQSVFDLLRDNDSQQTLQATANLFWQQGANVLNYGKVNCAAIADVLAIDQQAVGPAAAAAKQP